MAGCALLQEEFLALTKRERVAAAQEDEDGAEELVDDGAPRNIRRQEERLERPRGSLMASRSWSSFSDPGVAEERLTLG